MNNLLLSFEYFLCLELNKLAELIVEWELIIDSGDICSDGPVWTGGKESWRRELKDLLILY